jgi:hypothetical protein
MKTSRHVPALRQEDNETAVTSGSWSPVQMPFSYPGGGFKAVAAVIVFR